MDTRKELDIDGTFIGCRIRDLKPDSENVPCYFLVLERWHLFVHSRIIEIQCLRIAGEEAGDTRDSISICAGARRGFCKYSLLLLPPPSLFFYLSLHVPFFTPPSSSSLLSSHLESPCCHLNLSTSVTSETWRGSSESWTLPVVHSAAEAFTGRDRPPFPVMNLLLMCGCADVHRQENCPVPPPPPPTPSSRPASSASVREDPVEDPFVDSPTGERRASLDYRSVRSALKSASQIEAFSSAVSSPRLWDILRSPEQSETDPLSSPHSGRSQRVVSETSLNWDSNLPM